MPDLAETDYGSRAVFFAPLRFETRHHGECGYGDRDRLQDRCEASIEPDCSAREKHLFVFIACCLQFDYPYFVSVVFASTNVFLHTVILIRLPLYEKET